MTSPDGPDRTAAPERPHAPSCERNRGPILDVLRRYFADNRHVLEIGSGTGQHAVHFAAAMPWLSWQASDVADALPGISLWLEEAALPNTPAPVELDVARGPWPQAGGFDAVFTANTLHIMGWHEVQAFFDGVGRLLRDAPGGTLVAYGPFNYGEDYTSASNREFDAWLKARDPRSGIRGFEAVSALATEAGLARVDDLAMPANNRCLVFRRA